MTSSQLILPVFSSAIGIAVSFLLLILLCRQKERDTGIKAGIVFSAVVLFFFGAFLAAAILKFQNVSRESFTWQLSAYSLIASSASLPSLVIWSWRASSILEWHSRFSKMLLRASWLCSGLVLVAVWAIPGPPEVHYLNQIVGVSSLACLTPAVISILRLPLDRRLNMFMRVAGSIYLASACVSLFIPPWNSKPTSGLMVLALLRLFLLLVGLIGSFILSARFRLADVFLRWSIRLTVVGVLAMSAVLIFPLLAEHYRDARNPTIPLMVAFFVGALLSLGNWSMARCESWAEMHILQRVDLKSALSKVRGIFSVGGEPRILFSETEASLKTALEAKEVRIVDAPLIRGDVEIADLEYGTVMEVPRDLQPMSIGDQHDVELIAPIVVNEKVHSFVCISPGTLRRALFSGELQFVKEVAQQLGLRLQQIAVEAETRRQMLRESFLRQQLAEAELRALQAQVNPHFLFNSLNTIADLIVRDPNSAERMTVRLSQVFRHVLAQSKGHFVTLGEEFLFLSQYLDIEQERFGSSLHVSLKLSPEADRILVPSLLLQPLVENAMKHGLAPKGGIKNIALRAELKHSRVHVEVCDNGVGFSKATRLTVHSPDHLATNGVGLANTLARLRTVYGDNAEMRIQSAPMRGCKISICFKGEPKQCDA